MPFTDATPVRVLPDVVSRVVAGEALIVEMKSGHYFGLDAVGTRIWELIREERTVGGIVGAMLEEFDVEEATLRTDLERLLMELEARGLVQAPEAGG